MEQVDRLMHQAISDNVFPGGVLLVSKDEAVIFFEAYGYADIFSKRSMTVNTIFDLASLTKPLATTLAVMKLVSQNKLSLDQHIGSILPPFTNTIKEQINIKHLLYHNSGFPDYRPYYKKLRKLPENRRRDALKRYLSEESLINPIGKQVLYSDLGFMILGWAIEHISGSCLDRFIEEEIYNPLGLEDLFFVDLAAKPRGVQFASTELCPWRKIILNGLVHDDNAYMVGGIDGHAGLFGTADDIFRLLFVLQSIFHGISANDLFGKEVVKKFFERDSTSGRALGFDSPSLDKSSCGRYFSMESVGHLGFTGTSFWIDLVRNIIVILLTNRVHPSRNNNKIKTFRPILHDTIMENVADPVQ